MCLENHQNAPFHFETKKMPTIRKKKKKKTDSAEVKSDLMKTSCNFRQDVTAPPAPPQAPNKQIVLTERFIFGRKGKKQHPVVNLYNENTFGIYI